MEKISDFPLFIRFPLLKQFIKFGLVGFSNLAVDVAVYTFLTRIGHFYYLLAAVCSFIVAVTWSFYFNRRWTFRYQEKGLAGQYAKFFTANVIGFFLNTGSLFLAVSVFGLYDLGAKFFIAIGAGFFNFTLNRFWTFGRQPVKINDN